MSREQYEDASTALQEYYEERLKHRRIRLEAARERDGELAQKRKELSKVGKGRQVRQLSVAAVMNAVDTEGREVLTAAGEEYWKDQDRREFGIIDGAGLTGLRNRWGRVKERKVYR